MIVNSKKEDYLHYLDEFGLTESDVLPMLDLEKFKTLPSENKIGVMANLAKLLLGWKSYKQEEREKLQPLLDGLNPNNNTNYILEFLNEKFCEFIFSLKSDKYYKTYAGVFPTHCFNAHCTTKDTKHLILIDTGCFEILQYVIYVFQSKINESIKIEKIIKTIENYCLEKKYPSNEYDKELDSKDETRIDSFLLNWSEYFVLGHEYGHIFNNHLDSQEDSLYVFSNDKSVNIHQKSHQQEFEADIWSYYILSRMAKSRKTDTWIWKMLACSGPIIFLGIALLIEKYKISKGVRLDSHPPTEERIYMIQWLQEILRQHEDMSISITFF